MMHKQRLLYSKANQQGFTLIELILYVAIVTIMLSALTPMALNVIKGGVQSSTQQELYSQARYVSERIKYEIRNANGINSLTATAISLAKTDAAVNPTVIFLTSGKITITQGVSAAVNLNSNDTTITSITFTDYTSSNNKTKNIGFVFTIDDAYGSSQTEFQAPALTIQSSGEVRSN